MRAFSLAIGCLCVSLPAHAVGISGQGTWETTLQARDLDGNLTTAEAYYDTVLGITWLADANYAQTSGDSVDGKMSWFGANAWVGGLNPFGSGILGWRLPTTVDVGNDGCSYTNVYQGVDCGYNIDPSSSQMAHMYYVTMGNLAVYEISGASYPEGWGLSNTAPFSSVQSGMYWSATENAAQTIDAWLFDFEIGYQYSNQKANNNYAWAVHDGDVGTPIAASAVPLPASVWLLGSGLAGLIRARRTKSAARQ